MRLLGLIAVFLVALTSPAETLRQILKANGIPETTFSDAELDGYVNAATAMKDNRVLVAYLRVDENNVLTGNPHLIQFNRTSAKVLRSDVKPEDTARCCGSPESIDFIGDFAFVSYHINPSAAAVQVIGEDLKLVTTLYGFNLREVTPGKVAFIENMIHFAPAHPERLELADLHRGTRIELYPPRGDVLRAAFAREHARHLPPNEICMKLNDPCKPELYDEDIDFVDVDGHGAFTFTVHRDAFHAKAAGQAPDTVASETALYRYLWKGGAWLYCEERLPNDKANLRVPPQHSEPSTNCHCTPGLPVSPDMSNSEYSPFETHHSTLHSSKQ